MVRIPGTWHSFDHIEESLTLDELVLLMDTCTEYINESRTFSAALQNVDLTQGQAPQTRFDDIAAEVQQELTGRSPDLQGLEDVGIGFMEVD